MVVGASVKSNEERPATFEQRLGDEKAVGLRIKRGGGEGKERERGKGEWLTFFCYKLVTMFSEIKTGRSAGSSCQ